MCEWGKYKNVKLAYPRHNSKRTVVPVDKCISKLIKVLNEYGIHTLSSCCGHNKDEGSILINQNNNIIELKIPKNE